ncbi:MAG: hypothetical protein Q7S02_06670 [bacterium]|nr:hypothetical protein [bacterium]
MTWHVPVLARIIVGNILTQIILKKMVGLPSRARRFVWQFAFCALFGLVGVACTTTAPPRAAVLIAIACIGIVNSAGAWCQWRAMDISQSRTAVFTWADDLIAMGLGYAILAESKFLNWQLTIGVLVCVAASVAFPLTERWRIRGADTAPTPWSLFKWIAIYSVIWGGALFAMRYYGIKESVPISWFCAAWYSGSLLGAICVYAFLDSKERGAPLTVRGLMSTAVLAAFVGTTLALAYWSRVLAPITVVQPIQQVSEMVCPALVGLYVFKEARQLSWTGKILFAVAMIGGVLIALSFS